MSHLARLALVFSIASVMRGLAATPIKDIPLDEQQVVGIPVTNSRVTTVSFPGPIAALEGAGITTDGKQPAQFQLAHKPGAYFFSVRSLVKGAVTNLNVRWNETTYVLELQDSSAPLLAVNFHHTPHRSDSRGRAVTPNRLLGLLDMAKAYPALRDSHPEAVQDVEFVDYAKESRVMDYRDYEVRLEEALRFDAQDTLVFRVTLRNKTERELHYQPDGFSVRAGERVFTQSISDASGVMPPKSDSLAYFAITGTPTGGRNDLSLKNDFTIRVPLAEPNVFVGKAALPEK